MSVCHPDWRDAAACKGSTHLFVIPEHALHGRKIGARVKGRFARAKALCEACPVKAQCLADYLEQPDYWMIAGGLLPAERQALRKAAS